MARFLKGSKGVSHNVLGLVEGKGCSAQMDGIGMRRHPLTLATAATASHLPARVTHVGHVQRRQTCLAAEKVGRCYLVQQPAPFMRLKFELRMRRGNNEKPKSFKIPSSETLLLCILMSSEAWTNTALSLSSYLSLRVGGQVQFV